MDSLNVLGLFSGIGGFELGFERAGFNIAAMCEIEPYCRAVLKKHWPRVPVYEDVRELTAARLRADGIHVDVITGGFPCQDISLAGKGAGLGGERSGLWFEYRRLIEEIAPRWVVIENVAALRSRGLEIVLGQLAALRYDAEWHCIPASAVGAPHRRDRVWIVAYTVSSELRQQPRRGSGAHRSGAPLAPVDGEERALAHAQQQGLEGRSRLAGYLADELAAVERGGAVFFDTEREQPRSGGRLECAKAGEGRRRVGQWFTEPDVGRVANGVPSRVDRLRSLGNAVVPQIPEIIARAIRSYEEGCLV